MTAMTADYHIIRVGNGKYPRRVGFLSDIGMSGANQFSSAELSQQTLFEATDDQHGLIESIIVIHDGHIITQGQYMFQICHSGYAHIAKRILHPYSMLMV